jgi:hypothetical protein
VNTEIATSAAKASPPVTVTGMTILGVPLPDIAVLLTIVYTVLMAAHIGWKFYWDVKDRRRKESWNAE